MSIIIIDYGSGNLHSAFKAVELAAVSKRIKVKVSSDYKDVQQATRIILPGVGAFADCVNALASYPGILDALREKVLVQKIPFLGICVGMQMLANTGLERGQHKGLGWIKGVVRPLAEQLKKAETRQAIGNLKIPHMGWNELIIIRECPLLYSVNPKENVYFVHSYYFDTTDENVIMARTNYGMEFASVIAKDNIFAVQFHPEKSQKTGAKILENFLTRI